MRNLKYKTKYMTEFLKALLELPIEVLKEPEGLTVTAKDAKGLHAVLDVFEDTSAPLVYQISNGKFEVTFFDPKV